MSIAQLTAGTVMNKAAVLMNDAARSVYTYVIQVPYLQTAMQELQEYFELHSLPVTETVSAVIQMDAGDTTIAYDASPAPELPDDFVEPQQLWERTRNIDPWIPMTRRDYLPHQLEGVLTSQFIYFVWQKQEIKVLPSNQDNDIKIDYIRQLFTEITDENSVINIVNARTFLEFRTAALLAEFIEKDVNNANRLNGFASAAMDRATGITVKGKQTIMTRRRPFRAAYKRGGWVT